MRRFILIIACVLCVNATLAEQEPPVFSWALPQDISGTPFESVADRLRKQPVVRANFAQKKYAKGKDDPMMATGSFLLSNTKGLTFQTITPIPMNLVVTPDFLAIRDGKGKLRRLGSAMAHLRGYSDVIMSMFSNEISEIRTHFDVYFGYANEKWIIGLKPREKRLQKLMDYAMLTGDEHIEEVSFRGQNGGRTEFVFSNVRLDPPELTEEEVAIFIEK